MLHAAPVGGEAGLGKEGVKSGAAPRGAVAGRDGANLAEAAIAY